MLDTLLFRLVVIGSIFVLAYVSFLAVKIRQPLKSYGYFEMLPRNKSKSAKDVSIKAAVDYAIDNDMIDTIG